ncbi:MAG: hypothetical protein P8185_12780 [Deltaproteobacteria bacterium]|jgi:hypothetical protein
MDHPGRRWEFSHMIARRLLFLLLILISGSINAEQRCEKFSPNIWVGLNYDALISAGEYKGNRLIPLSGFTRSWEGGYTLSVVDYCNNDYGVLHKNCIILFAREVRNDAQKGEYALSFNCSENGVVNDKIVGSVSLLDERIVYPALRVNLVKEEMDYLFAGDDLKAIDCIAPQGVQPKIKFHFGKHQRPELRIPKNAGKQYCTLVDTKPLLDPSTYAKGKYKIEELSRLPLVLLETVQLAEGRRFTVKHRGCVDVYFEFTFKSSLQENRKEHLLAARNILNDLVPNQNALIDKRDTKRMSLAIDEYLAAHRIPLKDFVACFSKVGQECITDVSYRFVDGDIVIKYVDRP